MQITTFTQTKLALGSDVTLTFSASIDENDAEIIFNKLWLTIYRFEKNFSRFIPTSELMKLNFRAGQKVPISKAMYRILRKCIELSEITDGLFNPFVLPTLHKLG